MRPKDTVSFFSVTLHRPVAIGMVTLAAVVFGVFSYRLLPVELMPDITYPSLTVRTEYAGAAPQEVEENVTRPIEEALGVVGGLVRMSSISRAGLSDVTLEFNWGTTMSRAWQEAAERLDTVFLPEEAGKPLILRYDPSLDPVLRYALASTRPEDQNPEGLKRLRTYAEQELKRALEQVDGVAAVRVVGGLEERVSVELDEVALRRTGLSIQEVVRRLAAENVNLAGGDIKEGETQYLVRTVNEFQSLPEIAELVITRIEGRDVRLRDVGAVRSGWADRKVITRLHQSEAVEVELQKEADSNMVAMAARVREAVDGAAGVPGASAGLRGELPSGWTLQLVSDRSTFVKAAVDEVRNTALMGGLLAILILYLFLRDFRATAVISVAIPVSVAATFAPMNLAGLSLNIMSLGGLALGVGMLVDSGIVVVESIARCREEGDPLGRAVVRGTTEVGTAVVASTLTTVAVFLPMVLFGEGVAGQVFGDLAMTVIFSLMASLLVAVFLVPALFAKVGGLGEAAGPAEPAWRRFTTAVRYRSLGPLSEGTAGSFGATLAGWLPLFPLLLVAVAVLSAWPATRPAGLGIGLGAASLGMAALAVNFLARIRAASGVRGILGAILAVVSDALLLALEGIWLLLIGGSAIVGGMVMLGLWVLGRAFGGLLAPLLRAFDAAFGLLQRVYPVLIRGALANRKSVLLVAAICFVLMAVGFLGLDALLLPEVHQGEFDVEVTLPVGTPIERTLDTVVPIEMWALGDPRVDRVLVKVGADPDADAGPEEGDHTARITMHLAPEPEPEGLWERTVHPFRRVFQGFAYAKRGGIEAVREEAVVSDLRALLERMPDLRANVTRPVLFSFRTPIEVEVQAFDLDQLRLLGDRVTETLDAMPGLSDVKSSARPGNPEVQIVYDREALIRLGLDLRNVADLVRTKVQGTSATEYRQRERRIDVVVRLTEVDRATVGQLRNMVVNPGAEVPIPLSSVASVDVAIGPADIRRVGQRRVAVVQANLDGFGLARVGAEISERLSAMDWPDGTGWRLTGQAQEMERSSRALWLALGLSVFLVYVVMAIQFESLLHPLLIMVTVPLALLGVVGVMHLLGVPLSVVVFLGMIILAGIVVNNAIVMVDYTNRLRGRGLEVEEALVEAGRARLRPIFMTTGTTVLGLLPMALGLGDGAEIRTPLALTVIAGLISSTVLTLLFLPTVYAAAESALAAFRAGRRETAGSAAAPATGTESG
jgi:hydrophobic/amphiphilic exporter-1 (mainly G- bacteria), HAE1 family